MEKTRVIGDLEVGGQRGRIFFRGGCIGSISATEYKDPQKVIKRWKKESEL